MNKSKDKNQKVCLYYFQKILRKLDWQKKIYLLIIIIKIKILNLKHFFRNEYIKLILKQNQVQLM